MSGFRTLLRRVALAASENLIGLVGGTTTLVADEFTRPADTTAYAAGDAVSATTSDTGTTVLRSLASLARVAGGTGYITKIRLWTDQVANVARYRIHFYKVAAPTTAVVGDNAQMTLKYTNFAQRVGHVDLPAMATSTVSTNSTAAETSDATLRLAFACAAGDPNLYYRIETLTVFTPANAQKFYLEVTAENN